MSDVLPFYCSPLPLANFPPCPPAVCSFGERTEVRLGPARTHVSRSYVVPTGNPEGHQQGMRLSIVEAWMAATEVVIRRSLVRAQVEEP